MERLVARAMILSLANEVCSETQEACQGVADESKHNEEQEQQELVNLLIFKTIATNCTAHTQVTIPLVLPDGGKGFMKLRRVFQIHPQRNC